MATDERPELLKPDDESSHVPLSWDDPDEAPAARTGWRGGLTMRQPLLLLLVLGGALFMSYAYWPRASYLLQAGKPTDCGELANRPGMRQRGETLPELPHGRYCKVYGLVGQLSILATGEPQDTPDPVEKQRGRKYYVKLVGDNVFAVLAANRDDIVQHRLRQDGSLMGFVVDETGRMIDVDREPGLAQAAQRLRHQFRIPDGERVWLFDTTEQPSDRWGAMVIVGLMVLTALLALFGLTRVALRYRK